MEKYQFEEITAALSIIITLLAYQFQINWLFYIYLVKSCIDTICAIKEAYKSAKTSLSKKKGSIKTLFCNPNKQSGLTYQSGDSNYLSK